MPFAGNHHSRLADLSDRQKPVPVLPGGAVRHCPTRSAASTTFGIGATSIDDDQRYVRIDHQLSDKDKLFGHYAFDDISTGRLMATIPTSPTSWRAAIRTPPASGFTFSIRRSSTNFVSGYMRSVDNTLNPRTNTNFNLDALGLTGFRVLNDNNRPFTSREAGLPPISFSNFTGIGDNDGGNGFDFNNQYELGDNVTISHGAHNFKMGFMFTQSRAGPRRRQRRRAAT